jgi:multidrug efflux system membrane fusion protein
VTAGAPVVRIAADGVRDVVFSVPEDKVAGIKPGSAVKIRVWSLNTELAGKVREVAASSDPVTRTYTVKVSVDAKEPPPLGATVYVVPESGAAVGAPVIKLPTTALRQEGKSTAVWVVDKATMTVKPQIIQVATADGNEVVVGSGLQPGMLVVSAGVHVLSPGQKVTFYQPSVALAGATAVQATGVAPVSAGSASAPASAASGVK